MMVVPILTAVIGFGIFCTPRTQSSDSAGHDRSVEHLDSKNTSVGDRMVLEKNGLARANRVSWSDVAEKMHRLTIAKLLF